MKGKVLGGYTFTSKKGSALVNLTIQEDRVNCVGTCCTNVMCNKDSLPGEIKDILGKSFIIDQNGSFASAFYEVK